jgi:chromosome segregation ATPase
MSILRRIPTTTSVVVLLLGLIALAFWSAVETHQLNANSEHSTGLPEELPGASSHAASIGSELAAAEARLRLAVEKAEKDVVELHELAEQQLAREPDLDKEEKEGRLATDLKLLRKTLRDVEKERDESKRRLEFIFRSDRRAFAEAMPARLEQLVGAARAAATHPRGIVMAAGNLNYLANAFVTVFVLRRFHGCKLPMTLA